MVLTLLAQEVKGGRWALKIAIDFLISALLVNEGRATSSEDWV